MKNSSQTSAKSFVHLILALLCLLAAGRSALVAQAPKPDSPEIEARAKAMLAKLTLEEKIRLLGGVDGMFTQEIPSIGLPRFKMSDASVGVRTWGPTTAYSGGVALAATWDREFAHKLGESLGKDARARSVHFLLGPGVNIARSPLNGRNFEYLSEDPFLNGEMVVPYIDGVQSQGVIATVKHYAANNQEFSRHDTSSDVDERTLREIYLPSFEAAVTKGHVDAVMNSYNLLNNVHATQNDFLNLKVLKGEWGFQGILMSDWDSTYDSVGAANNGLDLEMPNARFMNAEGLLPAIKAGTVKQSTIDDKILRVLRAELRYGFTERPQFDPSNSSYSVADRAVALQGARESLTLLKNQGGLLPLDATKVKTIAVIGPDAWPAVTGGGGSSQAQAFEPVSILTGIANLVGPSVQVLYTRGLPDMNEVFHNTHWESVKTATYANKQFSGKAQEGSAQTIADWKPDTWWMPADPNPRSIRYSATYKAGEAGKHLLLTTLADGEGIAIKVDGKPLNFPPHAEGMTPQAFTLDLSAGQTIQVTADYTPRIPGTHLSVGIAEESSLVSEEAKKFASMADVVIVAAGFDPGTESEGIDRTFTLPWGQDALIEAVSAANQHTIVTLTGGGAVDTRRWLDKVPALLHTWYPGQEGGTAIAEAVFGKQNPEGKLPVSFERAWEENPSFNDYYPVKGGDTTLRVNEPGHPPVDITVGHVKYGDKLMVGYRYWTTSGKHPLFPFGFGLSYTTFKFDNLHVPPTATSGSTVPVSFDVTNSGSVAGAEVAQLYVSDPSAKADRPERELKGFEKLRLAPGETKRVTLNLDARAFSYWDEKRHKWTIDPGKFVIRVGDCSENTPLSADLTLQ